MCRYAAYLGPPIRLSELIYKPANSLVHQSTEAMRSPTRINADGFGVGWYAPEISPEPALFKDTSPVWNNRNLGSIAGKIVSPAIFAHIRSAKSFDPVTRENCHPFARGRLLWMHNGDIPGRGRLARRVMRQADDTLLAMIRGNTDSELAFTLFLTHLGRPPTRPVTVDGLAAAMRVTLEELTSEHRQEEDRRPLELNFCVTDGHALVATRFGIGNVPSLCWRRPTRRRERSVVVASEPLMPEGRWHEVGPGRMVVVRPDRTVEETPLAPPGASA